MHILHANWSGGALRLWAESLALCLETGPAAVDPTGPWRAANDDESRSAGAAASATQATVAVPSRPTPGRGHPFAVASHELGRRLVAQDADLKDLVGDGGALRLRLPAAEGRPQPSERLATLLGSLPGDETMALAEFDVPCVRVEPVHAAPALMAIELAGTNGGGHAELLLGHSLRYWAAVGRFCIELLSDQRFIPSLVRSDGRAVRAVWQPWLHDPDTAARLEALLAAMPAVARAAAERHNEDESAIDDQPWPILRDALVSMTDALVRRSLLDDSFDEAVMDRSPADPHVLWLRGLLNPDGRIDTVTDSSREVAASLLRDVSRWIGQLDETGRDQPLRLCLRLNEPEIEQDEGVSAAPRPGEEVWTLSLHLQHEHDDEALIDAEELWSGSSTQQRMALQMSAQPQELMLRELGRASRIYSKLEQALAGAAPQPVSLTTKEAYAFLQEHRPVLEESGIGVIVPQWWDDPASRLGVRLAVTSTDDAEPLAGGEAPASGATAMGLASIVNYQWQVAIGDDTLTAEQFEQLRRRSAPLAHVNGRWVVLRPEELSEAAALVEEQPGGEAKLGEVVRMAFGMGRSPNLPVLGLDASGWLSTLFDDAAHQRLPQIEQPENFRGELRPYQLKGLRWLVFLESLGLGACLADDMGLGKTIQLIALLLHERNVAGDAGVDPTLLIVPTSLIANWQREIERFGPELRVQIHHGPDRPSGPAFLAASNEHDVVITTYGLMTRDRDTLTQRPWGRVVLDEAQYIKNPPTKQTAAIRALRCANRVALTGTPLENRLSELWSIMEFCNPGYLGSAGEFRRLFAIPIERHRDQRQARRLRHLVQPFVLRRLKTDPTVISDLPSCVETKEYATLTHEQAATYQQIVDGMLGELERAEGIKRRGMVLAALVKLKQACNHPALLNGEWNIGTGRSKKAGGEGQLPTAERSGKCTRLLQMLEEVVASGDKALVFTQFRRMGHLLASMIRHQFDCEALFLHGGTSTTARQQMIDRFQSGEHRTPVFVLSLKAGGVGLNLTAANHVFHFDRWWNPAVESQATDRAFRIGQMRTVQVHKFVCLGTLEERIDQMLEQKQELSRSIIGSGEQWLTELTTSQLSEMLKLRHSALEGED